MLTRHTHPMFLTADGSPIRCIDHVDTVNEFHTGCHIFCVTLSAIKLFKSPFTSMVNANSHIHLCYTIQCGGSHA